MALTEEQTNTLLTFKQIKADIKALRIVKIDYVQTNTYADAIAYVNAYETVTSVAERRTMLVEIVVDESSTPKGDHTLYRYVPTDTQLPRLRTILEG